MLVNFFLTEVFPKLFIALVASYLAINKTVKREQVEITKDSIKQEVKKRLLCLLICPLSVKIGPQLIYNIYAAYCQIIGTADCRKLPQIAAYCRHIAVQVKNGGKLRQNLVDKHSAKFYQATISSLTTSALAALKISI